MTDPDPEIPQDPEEEPVQEIHSYLWKSSELVHNSGYFPRLVEAAAWKKNKEYTPDMLRYVASTEAIVDYITLPVGEGIDAALMQLVYEQGPVVDDAIEHLVDIYEPGTPPPEKPEDPEEE